MFKTLLTYAVYVRKNKKLFKINNVRLKKPIAFMVKKKLVYYSNANTVLALKQNHKPVFINNWLNIICKCS